MSRRNTKKSQLNTKRRGIKVLLIVIICILVAAIAGLISVTYGNIVRDKFALGTTINGINCSGMTVDETVKAIERNLLDKKVQIRENDQKVYGGDLESIGVTLNEEAIVSQVNGLMDKQKANDFEFLEVNETVMLDASYVVDEDQLRSVLEDNLNINTTLTKDATIEKQDMQYVISPEVYGDEFDVSAYIITIKKAIARSVAGEVGDLILAVDEDDFPKPSVFSTDEELIRKCDLYNKTSNAEITYTFGNVTETISKDEIIDMYITVGGQLVLSEEKVMDYVRGLSEKYNTYVKKRTFTTWDGEEVTLNHVTYGYAISEDGEYEKLVEELQSNAVVSREPVYYKAGFSRNGQDDLNGTYVEVDISAQYMWFYKYGSVVTESPCVTGSVAAGKETTPGMFYVAFKTRDYTLTGQDYNAEVKYWMPFNDGEGFHDAYWRSSFGGSIYKYGGSHGCVNLPSSVAAAMYEQMEAGIAVIVHQ